MRIVILAAGEGKRLRPLTDECPKCQVPLMGTPLIEYQLKSIESAGIKDVSIVTGYKSENLKNYSAKFFHNPNFDSTNMVYSLMCAKELFDGSDDVIIAYSDIIYSTETLKLLAAETQNVSVTVDLNWLSLWKTRNEDPLEDAETLKMDKNGFILDIGKRPKSIEEIEAQYMGLIKVKASFAKEFVGLYEKMDASHLTSEKNLENVYMTSFLQFIINQNVGLKAVAVKGGWIEVDTVDDLNHYEKLFKVGQLREFIDLSSFNM